MDSLNFLEFHQDSPRRVSLRHAKCPDHLFQLSPDRFEQPGKVRDTSHRGFRAFWARVFKFIHDIVACKDASVTVEQQENTRHLAKSK